MALGVRRLRVVPVVGRLDGQAVPASPYHVFAAPAVAQAEQMEVVVDEPERVGSGILQLVLEGEDGQGFPPLLLVDEGIDDAGGDRHQDEHEDQGLHQIQYGEAGGSTKGAFTTWTSSRLDPFFRRTIGRYWPAGDRTGTFA